MSKKWQIQEAKAQFSRVVREAQTCGPQDITMRGEPIVVIISIDEYEKLTERKKNLVQFLRESPLMDVKLDLTRDKSKCRDIEL